MNSSIFIPKEKLKNFMKDGSMNHQYGIQVFALADRAHLQSLVPEPLHVPAFRNDGHEQGMVYIYIVNIREPTFCPWYMEGGVGILTEFNGITGVHFLGLQLSGPGALMGMCSGRESSGLPKKMCETIHVERNGDTGHCYIERGGVRLLDVKTKIGEYNDPVMHTVSGAQESCSPDNPVIGEGGCLLFKSSMDKEWFDRLDMVYYDSFTRFTQWDPLTAEVVLKSTPDDPWGELMIEDVLGGGWMVSDNGVRSVKPVYSYPKDKALEAMQYLFTGRYDQCTLMKDHQIYE